MNLLLDTHVFLWLIAGHIRLSAAHRRLIRDAANEVYLSVVSVWEAVIKYSAVKLSLSESPDILIQAERSAHGIRSLALDERSPLQVGILPPLHKDPFDRTLISQAVVHNMHFLSDDPIVRAYPVSVV